MEEKSLELQSVIGFRGVVKDGLIFHPDNERMIHALGSAVIIRHLKTQTQSFLHGHDNQINALALSLTGRYLASGQHTHAGFQADIIVWDFEAGKLLHRLKLHKYSIKYIAFSPNEKYLASLGGEQDNNLIVSDIETGTAMCCICAANDTAHCVQFYRNNDLRLITAGNYHVRMWYVDLRTKKLRPSECHLAKFQRVTTNIIIDAKDSFLYCGTKSGDILQVSMDSGLFKRSGPPKKFFSQGITCTRMLPNGDILVGTGNGTLAKLQAESLKVIKEENGLDGEVSSIVLCANGIQFYVGTLRSNIYCVDIETLKSELRNTCHFGHINRVVFPYKFSNVFATCSVNDLRVWNTKTSEEILRIQVPNLEAYTVCFTRDGNTILSGWSDDKIRAFLPQSGRLKFVIHDANRNGVTALTSTSDASLIISGGMEGEVRVWRCGLRLQTLAATMKEHRKRVWRLQLRQNDQQVLSASSDGSIIEWDLNTFNRIMCLFDTTMFKGIVSHPDETQLLSVGSDKKIIYWDTFDGQQIRVLESSDTAELTSIAISQNGSHLVTSSSDGILKWWDYEKGLCSHVGIGHSDEVSDCAISPDQALIVSVGKDGAVFIWKVPAEIREAALNICQS